MARCLWCTEELEESSMVFCSRSCEEALCHAMVIYVAWKRKTRITSKPIITDNAGYIAGSAHCATYGHRVHSTRQVVSYDPYDDPDDQDAADE